MKQENLKQKNFNDMNILITGANGQLGNEMRNVLSGDSKCSVVYTDVAELDLTNAIALEEFFSTHAIDVVVNCAAYTAVDAAEDNEKLCRLVNVEAVRLLATAAQNMEQRSYMYRPIMSLMAKAVAPIARKTLPVHNQFMALPNLMERRNCSMQHPIA